MANENIVTNIVSSKMFVISGAALVLAWVAFGVMNNKESSTVSEKTKAKIAEEFPQTEFIDFNQTEFGLIEALTNKNVFYFDQDTSVVIVGEVLDVKNKVSITAERRKHLSKFGDLDRVSLGDTGSDSGSAPKNPQPRQRPAAEASVDLTQLGEENYIVHNEGAGKILYVVSDYNCGFCKKLNVELKDVKDIEIREIPVRFMSDDSTIFGAHALCADDPSRASNDIFDGERSGIVTCEEGIEAVGFNTRWASEGGINGTPALITEDGRVSSGYRQLEEIKEFIGS